MREIIGILKENPVKPKCVFKVWRGVPCALCSISGVQQLQKLKVKRVVLIEGLCYIIPLPPKCAFKVWRGEPCALCSISGVQQLQKLKVKRIVLIEGLYYIIPLLLTRGLNKVQELNTITCQRKRVENHFTKNRSNDKQIILLH